MADYMDTVIVKGVLENCKTMTTNKGKVFKVLQIQTVDSAGYKGFVFVRAVGDGAKEEFKVGKELMLQVKESVDVDFEKKRVFNNKLYFGVQNNG